MVYRCAIIGLGRIGCGFDDNLVKNQINTHAGAYQFNKKTKLVALCDIDKVKLKKYGKKFKIKKLYSNYKEMLKNEKLDCISICTLADSHYDIIKIATKYVNGISRRLLSMWSRAVTIALSSTSCLLIRMRSLKRNKCGEV